MKTKKRSIAQGAEEGNAHKANASETQPHKHLFDFHHRHHHYHYHENYYYLHELTLHHHDPYYPRKHNNYVQNISGQEDNNREHCWLYRLVHPFQSSWSTLTGLATIICCWFRKKQYYPPAIRQHHQDFFGAQLGKKKTNRQILKNPGGARCWTTGWQTFLPQLWHGFRSYCCNSSIVGLRYLVEPKFHFSERIFWTIALLVNLWLTILVMTNYLTDFQRNIFKVVLEEVPRSSVINFPSIGFCERAHHKTRDGIIKRLERLKLTEDLSLESRALFYNYSAFLAFENLFEEFGRFARQDVENLPDSREFKTFFNQVDMEQITDMLLSNCSEFFKKCTWLETDFDCCKYFGTIETMAGKCFLLNSYQTRMQDFYPMKVTISLEDPQLLIEIRKPARIFLLNRKEIPETITPVQRFKVGRKYTISNMEFSIEPMANDLKLLQFDDKTLDCFPLLTPKKKNPFYSYPYMSYTTCLNDCIRMIHFTKCGCISHFMRPSMDHSHCDLDGYMCLYENDLIDLQFIFNRKEFLPCKWCVEACSEYRLTVDSFASFAPEKPAEFHVMRFSLSGFPRKQLRRQLLRTPLDVVVSLGGLLGLFMGCNMIHLLDLVFTLLKHLLLKKN